MFNWPEPRVLTDAEERLHHDYFWGPVDYPPDLKTRDEFFRDGLTLLREITNQPDKVRRVIASYLHFAVDPALRHDLEKFLGSLPTPAEPDKDIR